MFFKHANNFTPLEAIFNTHILQIIITELYQQPTIHIIFTEEPSKMTQLDLLEEFCDIINSQGVSQTLKLWFTCRNSDVKGVCIQ